MRYNYLKHRNPSVVSMLLARRCAKKGIKLENDGYWLPRHICARELAEIFENLHISACYQLMNNMVLFGALTSELQNGKWHIVISRKRIGE
jgi:hypothetical protein